MQQQTHCIFLIHNIVTIHISGNTVQGILLREQRMQQQTYCIILIDNTFFIYITEAAAGCLNLSGQSEYAGQRYRYRQ